MTSLSFSYRDALLASVAKLADAAFMEDAPQGDVTAEVLQLERFSGVGKIICRETIHMCGSAWYGEVLQRFISWRPNAELEITCHVEDGQEYQPGTELFSVKGRIDSIVEIERPLLNFLGRAIGIANATALFVNQVRRFSERTQIFDTRKTLPAYRFFDKYAVLCGGGRNHRMGLSDQVLVKENHIPNSMASRRHLLLFART